MAIVKKRNKRKSESSANKPKTKNKRPNGSEDRIKLVDTTKSLLQKLIEVPPDLPRTLKDNDNASEEVNKQVKLINTDDVVEIDKFLFEIRDNLLKLPEETFLRADLEKKGFEVNEYPFKPFWSYEALNFSAPASVHVTGDYMLGLNANVAFESSLDAEDTTVELLLEMPKNLFHERDFIQYRYYNKKLLYCLALLKLLSDKNYKAECAYYNMDRMRPCINIRKESLDSIVFILKPIISADLFPLRRLTIKGKNLHMENGEKCQSAFYNHKILQDMRGDSSLTFGYQYVLNLYHETAQAYPSLKQSILLIRRFYECHLRATSEVSVGCFGSEQMETLLLFLLQNGAIVATKDPFSMFKGLLTFISNEDLGKKVLRFSARGPTLTQEFTSELEDSDFQAAFPLNLISSCGMYNFFWQIQSSEYKYFRKLCSTVLQNASHALTIDEGLRRLFSLKRNSKKKSNFWQSFDRFFEFTVSTSFRNTYNFKSIATKLSTALKTDGLLWERPGPEFICYQLDRVISQGLLETKRVSSFKVFIDSVDNAKVSKVIVGINLNLENAHSLLDKGPSPDDNSEAQRFRDFWKNKTELRRFNDGSILESVIWATSQTTGIDIINNVMNFIFAEHLKHSQVFSSYKHLSFEVCHFPKALRLMEQNNVCRMDKIKESSERFKNVLRILDMDLSIKQVSFVDPLFRLSGLDVLDVDCFHELLTKTNDSTTKIIRPLKVVVGFESSPKWPRNLNSIALLEHSLFIEMGDKLKVKNASTSFTIRSDSSGNRFIILFNGVVFEIFFNIPLRRELLAQHEKNILEDQKTKAKFNRIASKHYLQDEYNGMVDLLNSTLTKTQKKRLNKKVRLWDYRFDFLPDYQKLLTNLHISFGNHFSRTSNVIGRQQVVFESIKLCKFWVHSQNFSGILSDEIIELLVVQTFLSYNLCHEVEVAKSPVVAFEKFLLLLGSFPFEDEPLIVDLLDFKRFTRKEVSATKRMLSSENQQEAIRAFKAYSMNSPESIFIVTNTDFKNGALQVPPRFVIPLRKIQELRKLAVFSAKYVSKLSVSSQNLKSLAKPLFTSDLTKLGCDFIIHLNTLDTKLEELVPQDSVPKIKFKNLLSGNERSIESADFSNTLFLNFNSVAEEFVAHVEKQFPKIMDYFYNKLETKTPEIGFKLRDIAAARKVSVDDLIQAIVVLGDGIVSKARKIS